MTISISKREKIAIGLLVLQLAMPVSIFLLHPGFDKPNALGLDFGFVIFVGFAYLVTWLTTFILACILPARRGWYICACILSPVICFGFLFLTEQYI
jgi:hypothetical protein